MALDPALADQLTALTITNAQHSMALVQVVDKNLTQGLGVVNTTLIQQHGAVSDDAAVMAALNTGAGIPQSGYQKGAA